MRGTSRSAAKPDQPRSPANRNSAFRKMDFGGDHYYKLNRIFLSAIGLWPHGHITLRHTQAVMSSFILISMTFPQVWLSRLWIWSPRLIFTKLLLCCKHDIFVHRELIYTDILLIDYYHLLTVYHYLFINVPNRYTIKRACLFSVNKIDHGKIRYRSHFKSSINCIAIHAIYCKIYLFLFYHRESKYGNDIY